MITSIYERKPCFLASPGWREIAFDKTGLSFDDGVYTELLNLMADFPALLRELKDLDSLAVQPASLDLPDFNIPIDCTGGPVFEANISELPPEFNLPLDFDYSGVYPCRSDSLLAKLHSLKSALCTLGVHLNAKLVDGMAALELPSIEEGSPIPLAFHFQNWRVTVAYNCFWSLLILTNKLLMKLTAFFDATYYALESECRSVAYEICKTWEDGWASKPIGAFHTGLSFVLAYEYCNPDVKDWVLRGLNALLDNQQVENFCWTDEIIGTMSGKLTGEGPDLVFRPSKSVR